MSPPIDTSASVPPPGVPLPPPALATSGSEKSEATAVLLTLVWPGAGHWYAGERDRAVAFGGATFVAAALSLAVPAIALIATIAIIWALLDARHAVKRAAV